MMSDGTKEPGTAAKTPRGLCQGADGIRTPRSEGYKKRTEYMMGQADYVVAVYDNDPKHYSGVETAIGIAEKRNLSIVLIHPDTGIINIVDHYRERHTD